MSDFDRIIHRFEGLANVDYSTALQDCGEMVAAAAISKCPVDTGQLRGSIHPRIEGTHTEIIGTNVEYAPYVEYGTGLFSSKGDGRKTPWVYWSPKPHMVDGKESNFYYTKGQRPQPFLVPALQENREEINRRLMNAIREALN